MAIKVIRICDECDAEHEQIIVGHNVGYEVKFICSYCVLEKGHIDDLRILEKQQDGGLGICCVKSILSYLDKKDISTAERIYRHDGDKIRQYPEIQRWFINFFGCRTHLVINCQEKLCLKMKQFNDEELARVKKN